jgi:hypothetical protein
MRTAQYVSPGLSALVDILGEARENTLFPFSPDLILVFGAPAAFEPKLHSCLRGAFPDTRLMGCSTAGEICQDSVLDSTLVLSAVKFEHARWRVAQTHFDGLADSAAAGGRIATALAAPDLHHLFVLAPGVDINGSALIEGVRAQVPNQVILTGGLASDGGSFTRTFVMSDEGISHDRVAAVAFYGERLRVGTGSYGGWRPFGPARRVTHANGNRLYELDGEPALTIYKRYLGEYASELPKSGLLFPFSMLGRDGSSAGLIRTILGIDERDDSLLLAGDVEPGGQVQLMQASTDALVGGAQTAAAEALAQLRAAGAADAALVLMVSCIGRKLVMGGRVDEEIEAVGQEFGPGSMHAGFYSNGELAPAGASLPCSLHNQTMTVTAWSEAG